MKFRHWFIMSILVLLAAAPLRVTLACSGGEPPPMSLNTLLANSDYLVKATVIEADDGMQNVILHAEKYLYGGSGPERLLLYRTDPTLSAVYLQRHLDTGCLYGVQDPMETGTTGYFALKRQHNGAYGYASGIYLFTQAQFLLPWSPADFDVKINAQWIDEEENLHSVSIKTEQQFVELVEKVSRQKPTLPLKAEQPLQAPLLVTTERGTRYIFPIDGGVPVKLDQPEPLRYRWSAWHYPEFLTLPPYCSAAKCELTSPDTAVTATLTDADTIKLDHPYNFFKLVAPDDKETEIYQDDTQLKGQAVAFSSTSESVVVWNHNILSVYMIGTNCCQPGWGLVLYPYSVADITLVVDRGIKPSDLYGRAVWSGDGTTLAYSDAEGVWVLDLFHQTKPELVVKQDGGHVPEPVFLSSNGRYLATTFDRKRGDWTTHDRWNGQDYENAVPSPDERYLAFIAPKHVEYPEDEVGCKLPIAQDCRVVFQERPAQFQWIDGERYFALICEKTTVCQFRGSMSTYRVAPGFDERYYPPEFDEVIRAAAFNPEEATFAVASKPTELTIDRPGYYTREQVVYDLTSKIDSPIVSVEWLPSFFYHKPV